MKICHSLCLVAGHNRKFSIYLQPKQQLPKNNGFSLLFRVEYKFVDYNRIQQLDFSSKNEFITQFLEHSVQTSSIIK